MPYDKDLDDMFNETNRRIETVLTVLEKRLDKLDERFRGGSAAYLKAQGAMECERIRAAVTLLTNDTYAVEITEAAKAFLLDHFKLEAPTL